MTRCSACSTQNPGSMNFCKMCGAPLRASGSGGTPVAGTPVISPAKVNPRSSLPSALAAVVASGAPRQKPPTTTTRRPMIAGIPNVEKPAPVAAPAPAKPTRTCPSCSAQAPAELSFCPHCGGKLDAEPAPAIVAEAVADTLAGEGEIVPLVKKRLAASAPAYARLIGVRLDGTDGDAYPIAEDLFDIGRREGQLLFDDRFLALRHARIERREGGAVVLQPLDGTNGVYVRLRANEVYPLVDGDHLLIGKEVLRFELVEPEERALAPAIQHGVRVFGSPGRAPWGRLRQIVQSGVTRDIYHLVPPHVVLGREEGDLRFADDEFMSRRHARISNHDGRYEVTDLESSNGTFVRVRGERLLKAGDVMRMGDQLLRYEPSPS